MPFTYATAGSGPSAGSIGWYNFGNLTLNPGDSVTGLTGTLNDGTVVTFDMSLALVSGTGRPFVATTVPTFPGSDFGTTGYTGLAGNVAMYGNLIVPPGTSAFTINNIVVKDAGGNLIPNYTVIIADAERTNLEEQWIWNTNGGGWNQLAALGAPLPTLTGLGTPTATITGNSSLEQGAYVLTTQTPSQLVLTAVDGTSSRQAFSIGFATTRIQLRKNVAGRIVPSDQFVLNIGGTPSNSVTTTGAATGFQTEIASIYATPGSAYTINEAMAPGSGSTLSQYFQSVTATNFVPDGSVPPTGALPITFNPALGDNVLYTISNVAPETFTKTVDKAFAAPGDVLTYTVTVTNPNNVPAANVLVTDPTPSGTTYIGNLIVSQPYTGTDPASGITITSIPANTAVTISWQVQVGNTAPTPNPIPNAATVSVPGGNTGTTNTVTTLVNSANVTANKTVDKAFAQNGDVLTYTITLNNTGNVAANNVVLTDAVPAGTTFVPGSVTGATGTPPTLTVTNPIPAGGSAVVTFKVLVGATVPTPNPVVNTATANYTYTVDPANPNGAAGTATSPAATTQVNSAIVSLVKTSAPLDADLGTIITYTLTFQNTGNAPANNVVLTDAVPAGTTFVPGSVTGATGTPPTLTLTNPVPAGGTAVVTFQVQVGDTIPSPNPIPNNASANFTFTVDPANPNGATGTVQSNTTNTPVNNATIITAKSVDKAYAAPGDILTYTLNLQNTGNTSANNVVITDAIPAGTTFVAGSVVGATGTPPTLTLPNPIPGGGSAAVTFQVLVNPGVPTPNPLPNAATTAFTYTVDPANPDGVTGTSDSNTANTVVSFADVTTTKTVTPAFAQPGDVLTYTITLQNNGNASANNVVLNDAVPAGTTYVPGSVTGATGAPPTLTLTSPVPAGGVSVVTYQVKVGNSVPNPNPVLNTATAAYTYTVNPANPNGVSATSAPDTAAAQINIAKLNVTKAADKSISYIGDVITYQIAVTNTGNVNADNVVLTDLIPNGTVYVPASLTVNVPFTGVPATGITLTNPVAPGQTVAVSFQIQVTAIPNPNPIVNTANVTYNYTVDPEAPDGVSAAAASNQISTVVFRYNYSQEISDLIQSVALEQAALANLANAEGAKIQAMVAMGNVTQQQLLCVNKSVSDMLESITLLESILKQKLNVVDCQIDGTNAGC